MSSESPEHIPSMSPTGPIGWTSTRQLMSGLPSASAGRDPRPHDDQGQGPYDDVWLARVRDTLAPRKGLQIEFTWS